MDFVDLNIHRDYRDVLEAWEKWKDKPKKTVGIRMGTLGEFTNHPEFLEILENLKPCSYITDGRILGTKGDPRRLDLLDKTIEAKSKVILVWSDSDYYQRALHELEDSKIDFILGVRFRDSKKYEGKSKCLMIPETDPDQRQFIETPSGEIMKFYKNILFKNNKIIITKDSINLKPIKIYENGI